MARGDIIRSARFVAGLVRNHRLPLVVSVTGAAVYAFATVAAAVVFGHLVDDVVLPAFDGSRDVESATIVGWASLIVAISVLRIGGVIARRYYAGMTSERVARSLRHRLGEAYARLPMSFHRRRSPGDLLAHVDTDTETLITVLHPLPFSIAVVFMAAFAAIAMLLIDPIIAVVAFAVFPALIVSNRVYTRHVVKPATLQQDAVGRVATVAHESFDGALVVKLLGREADESRRFDNEASVLRAHRVEVGNIRAMFEAVLDALPNLGIVIVILVGAWRVDVGAVTIGGLVQIAALFMVLALPMRVLGFFLQGVPPSMAAHVRLDTVFSAPLPMVSVGRALPGGPVDLLVRGLTLGHDDQTILSDVDLDVRAGETVALVGATGSGKSTLVAALAGLLPPMKGRIELGGVPVDDLDPTVRADAIRIAFQEAFLFADSIDANIALDRSGIERADIDEALVTAGADEFVADLPTGVTTVVGERGLTLSGGQRQRVALARALAGRPRLIVLDDATSAVDAAMEREILDALRAGVVTPSMLIVAHRLSTIRLADRVVFIKDGRVAGRGTHEQLLSDPEYLALATAYEQAEAER